MGKLLRPGDGFKNQRPELRDDVKVLQGFLIKFGYNVDHDGYFGKDTEKAVKDFQRDHKLDVDGLVGNNTWEVLVGKKKEMPQSGFLEGFRGDASWVHAREGHAGKAYWPGGESGVTLDPGVDLGYSDPDTIMNLYSNILSEEQKEELKKVFGLKGENAENELASNNTLKSIRVSKEEAENVFPFAVDPYWKKISERFEILKDESTPACIQTVMLSLGYNRGTGNKDLEVLKVSLEEGKWLDVADLIGDMQQDHKLSGIRKRRRLEADYIRENL